MPFDCVDRLSQLLAELVQPVRPDIVAGVATLGLSLAGVIARSLGHSHYLPLGSSRKPWYDEQFSCPVESVTSTGAVKRLWIDPHIVSTRVSGKSILIVDDGMSTGGTMVAAMRAAYLVDRGGVSEKAKELMARRPTPEMPAARLGDGPTSVWSNEFGVNDRLVAHSKIGLGRANDGVVDACARWASWCGPPGHLWGSPARRCARPLALAPL